jgi:hypothetical protein
MEIILVVPSPAAHLAMGGTLSRWERDFTESIHPNPMARTASNVLSFMVR